MRYFDAIIVGQGLAGTALAWQMEFAGRRNFLIIDREPPVTSSRIAAGLITPITGQRLVKTEHFEERFAEAEAFYRRVESTTGSDAFRPVEMLRLFKTSANGQTFETKQHTEFVGMIEANAAIDSTEIAAPLGGFTMTTAGQLDTLAYLNRSRDWFMQRGHYLHADVNMEEIELGSDVVRIPSLALWANRIIFCQGFLNTPSPYFAAVPFQAAQGDILTLRIPGYSETRVIHSHGIWLAPAGGDLYRCGSTYSWEPFDGQPSAVGRAELERKLKEFLKLPYEVVEHLAAVRPIIRESRPRLGMHPQFPQLGFFNGLGSKGALLAPHFARRFVEHLYDGIPLDSNTDVRRLLAGTNGPLDPRSSCLDPTRPEQRIAATSVGGNEQDRGTRIEERAKSKSLTQLAHDLLRPHLHPGDIAIDATAGNGHDTRFLAECVGPPGKVFAFDIQKAALDRTAELCRECSNVTLIERSHAEMREAIPPEFHGRIAAIMFNFGYLPGGEKSIVTSAASSVAALNAAAGLLRPGGWLSAILYVGHPGGAEEAAAVEAALRALPFHWTCETSDRANAPRLWLGHLQ